VRCGALGELAGGSIVRWRAPDGAAIPSAPIPPPCRALGAAGVSDGA